MTSEIHIAPMTKTIRLSDLVYDLKSFMQVECPDEIRDLEFQVPFSFALFDESMRHAAEQLGVVFHFTPEGKMVVSKGNRE